MVILQEAADYADQAERQAAKGYPKVAQVYALLAIAAAIYEAGIDYKEQA